jgi:hypothetical protein
MSDRDTDLADADSPAAEYDELAHLIVDGVWHPGDIVCTSDGVRWPFREDLYTSGFPETMERHASRPATTVTSAAERYEEPRRRGVKGQAVSRLLTPRRILRREPQHNRF